MLADMLLRPLALLLNRGLARSSSAQAIARELEGRILGLTVENAPLDLRLRISAGEIQLGLPDGATPDASLSGTLFGLGRLLRDEPQAAMREGAVRMMGDTGIAERFRDLLHFAAPDLEEELAQLIGDPLARQAGNAARALGRRVKAGGEEVLGRGASWLREEARLVPDAGELAGFADAVDRLVDDVARAEARIRQLEEDASR